MFRLTALAALLLAALPVLPGCGPKATEAGYRAVLDSYHGRHIDDLVRDWGPPEGRHEYADGRRVYSFLQTRREYVTSARPVFGLGGVIGGRTYGGVGLSLGSGSEVRDTFCRAEITADSRGRITGYRYEGTACRAILK